jgi:hypothetical protein
MCQLLSTTLQGRRVTWPHGNPPDLPQRLVDGRLPPHLDVNGAGHSADVTSFQGSILAGGTLECHFEVPQNVVWAPLFTNHSLLLRKVTCLDPYLCSSMEAYTPQVELSLSTSVSPDNAWSPVPKTIPWFSPPRIFGVLPKLLSLAGPNPAGKEWPAVTVFGARLPNSSGLACRMGQKLHGVVSWISSQAIMCHLPIQNIMPSQDLQSTAPSNYIGNEYHVFVGGVAAQAALTVFDDFTYLYASGSYFWKGSFGTEYSLNRKMLGSHTGNIVSIAMTENLAVTAGADDNHAKLWDTSTGELLLTLEGKRPTALAMSSEGQIQTWVALAQEDQISVHHVNVIGCNSGNASSSCSNSTGNATHAEVELHVQLQMPPKTTATKLLAVPRQSIIAALCDDGLLRVIDFRTATPRFFDVLQNRSITAIAVGSFWSPPITEISPDIVSDNASQNFSSVASVEQDHERLEIAVAVGPDVEVWTLRFNESDYEVVLSNRLRGGHESDITAVALNDLHVLTGGKDTNIRIWSKRDGVPIWRLQGAHSGAVHVVGWKSLVEIVSVGTDQRVVLWSFNSSTATPPEGFNDEHRLLSSQGVQWIAPLYVTVDGASWFSGPLSTLHFHEPVIITSVIPAWCPSTGDRWISIIGKKICMGAGLGMSIWCGSTARQCSVRYNHQDSLQMPRFICWPGSIQRK